MNDRIERHPATDRKAWLELRRNDVTASDVGCLFDCHPYKTALALYIDKTGFEFEDSDSPVKKRGRILEDAVARAVQEERPHWRITKATDYLRDATDRIGCTRDYLVEDGERHGIMQTKTVARSEFKKHWSETTPPLWIVLQNATELMLSKCGWGVIAALIIDPYRFDLHLYDLTRNAGVEERIRKAVRDFWTNTDAGVPPPIDFERDGAAISIMWPKEMVGKQIDLSRDNVLPELLEQHAKLASEIGAASRRKHEIDNQIKSRLADAEIATCGGWRITLKTRKGYTAEVKPSRVLKIINKEGDDG